MSREIRFRFWDTEEGKWLGKESSYWKELTFEDCRKKLIASMRQGNIIAEQYTGLTDKNGKEIYEGDIVKWLDGLGEYTNFVVEWQENRARFCLRNEYSHYDYEDINDKKKPYIEVIGNIHESNMEEMAKERKKTNGQIEKD